MTDAELLRKMYDSLRVLFLNEQRSIAASNDKLHDAAEALAAYTAHQQSERGLRERLAELSAKWQQHGSAVCEFRCYEQGGRIFKRCANELESALSGAKK